MEKKRNEKLIRTAKYKRSCKKIIESGKGKRYQDRLDTCFNEILFLGGFFYLRYKCMVGFQVLNEQNLQILTIGNWF